MPKPRANTILDVFKCRVAQVARAFAINRATIDSRIDAGHYELTDGKWLSLPQCAQAEFAVRSGKKDAKGTVVSIENARLKRAQAERVELQNAVERGELVRRDAVEVEYADAVATIVAMLDGLGSRLASQVAEQSDVLAITATIDAELHEIKATAAARLKVKETAG